jgi:hypothetical protein
VGLFRRAKPLHRTLADAAGLSLGAGDRPAPGPAAAPPDWHGEQRGEPGIHGVPRARRWDVVATAEAPGLRGDDVTFTALPDGTLLVEEDEPEGTLGPLADAVESTLSAPYQAEAVRRSGETWAVAARRIAVVAAPGLDGEEAELVVRGSDRSLTVDGRPRLARVPAFEAAADGSGGDYVVRASRLDGDLWQVDANPL